tara:strand:- start:1640 stop:2233 length:594 start_codon:yes stop_codon:yes gene_type:complete
MLAQQQPLHGNNDKQDMLLSTPRLNLVLPSAEHASDMVNFLCCNRQHFKHTFPAQPQHYTEKFWQQLFRHAKTIADNQQSLYVLLVLKNQTNIIGNICFDGIIRGALQAGYLGFKIGKNYQHQGFMHEALGAIVRYLFNDWNIHRIMANYRVGNDESEKLLHKLNFQQEGLAKDYLYIDGQWRDHILTSLVNPYWRG